MSVKAGALYFTAPGISIVHDANPRFGACVLLIGQGVVGLLTAEILIRGGRKK